MKIKIFTLFLINFFTLYILASDPPQQHSFLPHIKIIFDQDTDRLCLRWTDDPNQFLLDARLPENAELCRKLTQKHFQEIRTEMQLRIQRSLELQLEPLKNELGPRQQMVTTQHPLPSVDSIMSAVRGKKRPLEDHNGQEHTPLTAYLRKASMRVHSEPTQSSLILHKYIPKDPVPFKAATPPTSPRKAKGRRTFETVWRQSNIIKITDCSEPG